MSSSYVTVGMLRGVGAFGAAQLIPGVDYHHPVGLRIRYGFTRKADKAPIPTEKPPAGMWYVLARTPTGAWYYDVQKKPGAAPAAPAPAAPKAAPPAAPAAPKVPARVAAPAEAPADNTMLYVAGGIGAVAVLGVIIFALRKR